MFAARRIALALTTLAAAGGAALATAPAQAAPLLPLNLNLPVNAGLFPLHIEKTVNVGTVDVFGGPAGEVPIPVGAGARVGVTLNTLNPLLVLGTVSACPNGELGVLIAVRTLGSTLTGDVSVATNTAAGTIDIPLNVGAADTKTVGVCLQGTSVS